MKTLLLGCLVLSGVAIAHSATALPMADAAIARLPTPDGAEPEPIVSESGRDRRAQGAAPDCGTGEFASTFRDVLPSDWAYEAVTRLAAPSMSCFPLPVAQ